MLNAVVIKESSISLCHYLGNNTYKFIGDDLNCIHTANSISLTLNLAGEMGLL